MGYSVGDILTANNRSEEIEIIGVIKSSVKSDYETSDTTTGFRRTYTEDELDRDFTLIYQGGTLSKFFGVSQTINIDQKTETTNDLLKRLGLLKIHKFMVENKKNEEDILTVLEWYFRQ